MSDHSPMNEYVFDYRLVLNEDPAFGLFVDRVKPSQYDNPFEDPSEDPSPNETPFEESMTTRDAAMIEWEKTKDNAAEEEIINFVHDREGDGSKNHGAHLFANDGLVSLVRLGHRGEKLPNVSLKRKYEDPPNPNYDPSIPQLLPPTRFLGRGSKIWLGDNTFYFFTDESDDRPISIVHRYRFSQRDGIIRLQDTQYWFNRAKNIMSEKKKYFKMSVYNTKTRQLYQIKKVQKNLLKTRSRFRTQVRNAFNGLLNSYWNGGNMPRRLSDKFLNSITQAVVRDTGKIVMFPMPRPHDHSHNNWATGYSASHAQTMNLIVAILQHRVGQPVRWLNYTLMNNIFRLIMDTHFQEQIIGIHNHVTDIQAAKKKQKKLRRNTVLKMIPELRKSNHMRTAIKTLLGEDYNKFLVKLFNIVDTDTFITPWVFCMRRGLVPKEARHWLVQTINSGDITSLKKVMDVIEPLLTNLMHGYSTTESSDELAVNPYIKICKRFVKEDLPIPTWHTWMDVYRMADQLRIRVRPNKLSSAGEITDIHNRMSGIINRDRSIIRKYKDIVFEEFLSPDKEYDGFRFVQLRTAEELRHEGTVMHHCVGGYASHCTEGKSIIFSMRKDDKSYITIELNPRNGNQILQQYTLHDITVTNGTVLDLIQRWHSDCLALHKNDKRTYRDICQDKIRDIIAKEVGNLKDTFQGGEIEYAAAI